VSRKLIYNGLGIRLVPQGELAPGQVVEFTDAEAEFLLSIHAGFAEVTDDLPAGSAGKRAQAKAAPGGDQAAAEATPQEV
jgi:hypothetical protein